MLEKDDLTDGEIHQECSLEDGRETRHESWSVKFLFVFERYDFSETCVLSASQA